MRDGHRLLHDARGDLERVLAERHRRGPGVRLHARDDAVVPAEAEHAGHDADGLVGVFEHGSLLDVRLEVGAQRVLARLLVAHVADAPRARRRTLFPSTSLAAYTDSRLNAPAKTPEPIITGTNREPSSFVQKTTSMGASVSMWLSSSVRTTSRPASTP